MQQLLTNLRGSVQLYEERPDRHNHRRGRPAYRGNFVPRIDRFGRELNEEAKHNNNNIPNDEKIHQISEIYKNARLINDTEMLEIAMN